MRFDNKLRVAGIASALMLTLAADRPGRERQ